MSPTYTAIVADIEQTIFAGACKLSESLHVTKTCHLFTNISDLNDYVNVNMCIENDFKRNSPIKSVHRTDIYGTIRMLFRKKIFIII